MPSTITKYAGGTRTPASFPIDMNTAGSPTRVAMTIDLAAGIGTTEYVDLSFLPPGCVVDSFEVECVNISETAQVRAGFRTGTTVGNEIMALASDATINRAPPSKLAGIAPTQTERTIALQFDVAIAAGAGKAAHVVLGLKMAN